MTFGDFLYFVGFQVEYTAVRLARRVWAAAQWAAWAALTLLAVLLRPVVRAAANFKAALCAPRQLADYLLPVLACAALAVYLHTALSQPFVLRVEVNGQSVGYVAGEAAFEAARADVQARINGVADWQIQPEYTLVRGGADTPTLTEREIADAILRASGGEITEGTAVYIDGAAVHHHRGRPSAAVPLCAAPPLAARGCADSLCAWAAHGGRHLPCCYSHTLP